ncbi:MAG: protein-L-isoaspartate(D-aspartate) O-methyltransferase [Pseudomonadota bacterium]
MTAEAISGRGATAPRARTRMVDRLKRQGISDARVLDAMATVPRHIFVDEALSHRAYDDGSLPIGHRQTLSQPWVVAVMTQLVLECAPLNAVLELGTGSGYQAAVLSRLVDRVYTQERIQPLLKRAEDRLFALRYRNVLARHGHSDTVWHDRAPFDGIVLTAAATDVSRVLLRQLRDGGVLIAPVQAADGGQTLVRVTRRGSEYEHENLTRVKFVPLLSGTVGGVQRVPRSADTPRDRLRRVQG